MQLSVMGRIPKFESVYILNRLFSRGLVSFIFFMLILRGVGVGNLKNILASSPCSPSRASSGVNCDYICTYGASNCYAAELDCCSGSTTVYLPGSCSYVGSGVWRVYATIYAYYTPSNCSYISCNAKSYNCRPAWVTGCVCRTAPPPTPTPPPNRKPSCSIGLASSLTYDGKEYQDINGMMRNVNPTSHSGSVNMSDPDGDSVSITSITVNRSNCLRVTRSGSILYAVPQGHVTGQNPTLSGANYCNVTVRVYIRDSRGATNSCSKTIKVYYPRPRLQQVRIIDINDSLRIGGAPDSVPYNVGYDSTFMYVGGYAREPFRTSGARLQGSPPTQQLAPLASRFIISAFDGKDHNPFRLMFDFVDSNGNSSINYNRSDFYLDGPTSSDIPLLHDGASANIDTTFSSSDRRFIRIMTYGISPGGTIRAYSTFDMTDCANDPASSICVRGEGYIINNDTKRWVYDIYLKEGTTVMGVGNFSLRFRVQDFEGVRLVKAYRNVIIDNVKLNLLDNDLNIQDRNGNRWTGGASLYLDYLAPTVRAEVIKESANTLLLKAYFSDVGAGVASPPFRTYVFAENNRSGIEPDLMNRFLRSIATAQEIKGLDSVNNNLYGWDGPFTDAHGTYYKLRVGNMLGGDKISFGFCLSDRANNVKCYDSPSQVFGSAHNWLKTSLGWVYSRGGFSGFPNYSLITGIDETPYSGFVSPFNATQFASLSTFGIFSLATGTVPVRWGYDSNWNNANFYLTRYDMPNTSWYSLLRNKVTQVCKYKGSTACRIYRVNTVSQLVSALQATDVPEKIIVFEKDGSSRISASLPISVQYQGKNIIFVGGAIDLKLYDLRQARSDDAALFVVGKVHSYIPSIEVLDDANTGADDIDIIEAGFIVEDTPFKVVKGPKGLNGKFDRLIIRGMVYNTETPVFERDLVLEDNETYPSEWIIYDPDLLNKVSEFVGMHKMQNYNCELLKDHPLCN